MDKGLVEDLTRDTVEYVIINVAKDIAKIVAKQVRVKNGKNVREDMDENKIKIKEKFTLNHSTFQKTCSKKLSP